MAIPFIQGPTIRAGQSLSDPLDCSMAAPVRIVMPSSWTPANVTFQISTDGIQYHDLFDTVGKEVLVNVTPDTVTRLSSSWITAPAFLKFRSGTRSSPVVQTADRVFGCVLDSSGDTAVTLPVEDLGVKHIGYVERTTNIDLTTSDVTLLTTDPLTLDSTKMHAIQFFCPGMTFATGNVRATVTIKDNAVVLGYTDVAATDTPITIWRMIMPLSAPTHVLSVMVRKTGSPVATVKSGPGGANVLPSFIELLQY